MRRMQGSQVQWPSEALLLDRGFSLPRATGAQYPTHDFLPGGHANHCAFQTVGVGAKGNPVTPGAAREV